MNLVYGDHPEAVSACEDAFKIFLAAGNRLEAADCMRLIGDSQGAGGHFEQAIATYQRALNILQELGEHEKTGVVLNNMAIAFSNEGKLDRAEQLYRKAKYHFEQEGDKTNTVVALGNVADILYLRGRLPSGRLYQQAIASAALLDPTASAYAMYRLADLELAQGQTKRAQDLAAQAVDAMRPSHSAYQNLTGAMAVLGDALMAQEIWRVHANSTSKRWRLGRNWVSRIWWRRARFRWPTLFSKKVIPSRGSRCWARRLRNLKGRRKIRTQPALTFLSAALC